MDISSAFLFFFSVALCGKRYKYSLPNLISLLNQNLRLPACAAATADRSARNNEKMQLAIPKFKNQVRTIKGYRMCF
jgi:hypothetical protein